MKNREQGFTLVEVLIISPVVMVTIVLLMSYLFNQYGQLTQQGAQLDLNVEVQNITFSMQDDLFFTKSFESNKNDNLNDSFAPSGGWNAASTPQTLILSTAALTKNYRDANRQPVYIDTEGCTPQSTLEENSILYNNIIYFVSGTTFYKRILTAPTTMATCGTSYQKQTCPAASASSTCPADRILTTKLNSISYTYYDANNVVTATPENADKVTITLQLKDKAYAEDIYSSSTITLKKLNQ